MARYKITAPRANFTGVVAGVAFANGEATLTGQREHARALAYFTRRSGYTVADLDASAEEPEQAEAAPVRPGKSASRTAWMAYAVSQGVALGRMDNLTRDQIVEQIDQLIAEASTPADETPNGGPQE